MKLINACIIAFSTYSRIPMPQVEWNDDNMKYSICFFPFIGIVIGALLIGWYYLSGFLGLNVYIWAAVAASLSTVVTGGIHMDGFCDTTDALSSHQSQEKKLLILKDSNSGAFAIIKTCVYYMLYFAVFTQMTSEGIAVVAIGFVISRALSGLAVVNFKSARTSGLAATFKNASHKRNVTIGLIVILALAIALAVMTAPYVGILTVICALVVFGYYRVVSYRQFGGITGDLAGYFLVLCELAMAYGVVIAGKLFDGGLIILWN